MLRWLAFAVVALVTLTATSAIAADDEAKKRELSAYEAETQRRALELTGHEIDDAPEGKWIEEVVVVPFEVFEDRDWMPTDVFGTGINLASFANWFHVVSRPYVIEREVLLRPGHRFDWSLLRESERNLRVRQLSVVLIVPVRGSAPDRVRLMVVTKDVWSLRINFEPRFINGKLDFLTLQPAEENLFGTHKILNGRVTFSRSTYTLGLGFTDPRVGGSRLRASVGANMIFNCQSNDLEGASGFFSYGKPVFSSRTKWGWNTSVSWLNNIVRPAGTSGDSICTGGQSALLDFAITPERDDIPYEYRQDVLASSYSVTRSYGRALKNNLSFGLEAIRNAFEPEGLDDFEPAVQTEFLRLMPTGDTRISPFFQLHGFRNQYLRVIDFELLGLQEDHQIGHDVWFRVYPALKDVGSTRNLIGIRNGAGYTFPIGSGLWRFYVSHRAELSEIALSDAQVRTGTRFVTPRLFFGRFHFDGLFQHRYINYLNPLSSVGGTSRLRGYIPSAFVGPDIAAANVELRTRPVQILGAQLGAVAFFDTADAFRGLDTMELKHGYGGGLRFVFPQVERNVFRIDFGAPVDPNVPGAEFSVIAQFRQAFGMPSAAP